MKISIVRAAYFSCGYAYKMPGESPEENKRVYRELYSEEGYGRNFRVEASFSGPVDPVTGMILNLADIDQWIKSILHRLDHHFLNDDVDYFKSVVASPENITRYIFLEIAALIPEDKKVELTRVRLYENENRWIDFTAKEFTQE